jgi:hypothetical protein
MTTGLYPLQRYDALDQLCVEQSPLRHISAHAPMDEPVWLEQSNGSFDGSPVSIDGLPLHAAIANGAN